ncbi:triacylglycerol lipase [Rhodococcus sp. 27YEA15]|uniref:esterase/lipase family protein n=1 Tax=Rhodococcus sp. 27YEA15 TaxID=3156259 RepID=UPI003C7D29F0
MSAVIRISSLAFTGALALVIGTSAPASALEPMAVPMQAGPAQLTRTAAAAYSDTHADAAPAGSNDFDCEPTQAHPRPVVLAHGTDANAYRDWAALSPALAADGFCVFVLNYGGEPDKTDYGTGDITASAADFGTFVQQVLDATGADQVDVVGYSQGATVSRYYVNTLGGASKVGHWVGLASPTYGGVMYGLVPLVQAIPGGEDAVGALLSTAVRQQMQGSDLLRTVNEPSDTVPGVQYTTIGSRVDEMIQPTSNIALRGEGAQNIVLQDLCPQNLSGHFRMPYDPFVIDTVRIALDPAAERHAPCTVVPLGADIAQVIVDANS